MPDTHTVGRRPLGSHVLNGLGTGATRLAEDLAPLNVREAIKRYPGPKFLADRLLEQHLS